MTKSITKGNFSLQTFLNWSIAITSISSLVLNFPWPTLCSTYSFVISIVLRCVLRLVRLGFGVNATTNPIVTGLRAQPATDHDCVDFQPPLTVTSIETPIVSPTFMIWWPWPNLVEILLHLAKIGPSKHDLHQISSEAWAEVRGKEQRMADWAVFDLGTSGLGEFSRSYAG